MNILELLKTLDDNFDKLSQLPKEKFQIEKHKFEEGFEYVMFFENKSAFVVGETYHYDANDRYNEPYTSYPCQDYYSQRSVSPITVFENLKHLI